MAYCIDNYEISKNVIKFEITNNDKDVVMYNIAKEEVKEVANEVTVDNTLSTKSTLTVIVAIAALLTGLKIIISSKDKMIKEN